MRYSVENFDLLYEVLGLAEADSACDTVAVESIYQDVKRLHEVNGTLEAEGVMESIRFKIFMTLNIII